MASWRFLGVVLGLLGMWMPVAPAMAAPCAHEDFLTQVSGDKECLLMRRFGPDHPQALVVWLHGNVSTGGPANSHFRIAEKLAADGAAEGVTAVALVRPGYPDGTGAQSTGYDNGRADNWPRATVAEVGVAIERLRKALQPRAVVLVGHSGGAAMVAVLMGFRPELAHAALLVACPCDMVAWRAGRQGRPWSSEDPKRWTDTVHPSSTVLALTGSLDDTTAPELGRDYVTRLAARGVDARFVPVPGMGHLDILRSPALADATATLIRQTLRKSITKSDTVH